MEKTLAQEVIKVYTKEIDTIIKTTRRMYGRSPDVVGGLGAGTPRFFAYWRDALSAAATAIEIEIIRVPEYRIRMPFEKLHIYFSTASACHEDWADDPCISLVIPEGVRKGDIIRTVINYLYGEDITPIIHASRDENGLTWGKYLAYSWAWRVEESSGVPVFDIYCCTPEEFTQYTGFLEPPSPQKEKQVK